MLNNITIFSLVIYGEVYLDQFFLYNRIDYWYNVKFNILFSGAIKCVKIVDAMPISL